MKSKFINVIMFAAGAAIGSAVTWKLVKTKYERIAQEEIESVKAVFADRLGDLQGSSDDEVAAGDDDEGRPSGGAKQINWEELEDLDEADAEEEAEYQADQAELSEYKRLTNYYTSEKGGVVGMEKDVARAPYVIAPYDFGELDDYSQVELTYYADDVLEDDEYNIVTDRDELIGADSLFTFGEYEEDAVFVRNERLRADFQILKDYRTYAEARSVGPGQVDDE